MPTSGLGWHPLPCAWPARWIWGGGAGFHRSRGASLPTLASHPSLVRGRRRGGARAVQTMAPGRALMAGGALLSSAPGRVQPLPAFMLVVPPSLRADEVSLSGACGWGGGTGKGRMVADDRMWERDPPPAGPEGVGIPLGLESTRVLPSFWVGIRNPTWAVSSLHAAWGSRVPT